MRWSTLVDRYSFQTVIPPESAVSRSVASTATAISPPVLLPKMVVTQPGAAWSGAGSGCSAYEAKPSWQPSGACSRRTIADVSSVADPNTGVAVNSTYGGDPGWMVFGGTSAAAPFIAGVYAVGGVTAGLNEASLPYAHTSSLFDVVSGSNGRCTSKRNSSQAYLCTAQAGYDGPTGLGTPYGAGAF